MSNIKEKAIDLIRSLPDDCTIEDIQYHLYVCEKVEKGIQDVEAGRIVAQEVAEQKLEQWLQ